jgi:RNA polymerase sigma-70 factor (sigma-E family)
VGVTDHDGYREFVRHRMDGLRRTAYLLCGDWHTADDVVSVALVKLLRHWRRVAAMDNPDGYLRRMLLRAWLDERRRPWRREHPTTRLPERATADRAGDAGFEPSARFDVLEHLATLPPRRRAVLVLRYFCDLSVQETAEALQCSEGTVKSQTARALDTMRARMAPIASTEER